MSDLIRTFIAVEIESSDVLKKLIQSRDFLVSTGADIKPVEDENIHLTLRFIGEIPVGIVKALCNEITNLKFERFRIHIKGIGVFPSLNRPRVIWAGIEEGSNKVIDLHTQIERIIRKLGIPTDREEFTPHVTIARVKGVRGLESLIKALSQLTNTDFGYSDVTRVYIKKSVLTPSGPIYSNICQVDLL
ncbi:MAG: RNA 2',3'-cyclic phosphodiesterase [Desulfurococcaceae archaeon]